MDHIDHAIAIGKKYRHSLRMVTIEGESLNPGGSMTGGAFRNNSNLLGRRREIEELERSVRQLKKELEEMQHSISENRSRRNVLRDTIADIQEKLRQQYIAQNTAKVNLDQLEEKEKEIQRSYLNIDRDQAALRQQAGEIREDHSSIARELEASQRDEKELETFIDTKQKELEEQRENQISYMWEEYEITPNNALSYRNETMTDRLVIRQDVSRIKDEIRKLGAVNVNAIEDYKELLERHTFLSGQYEDIVTAEKTLEGIILELDEGMRKQFTEKFQDIQREFDRAFKELFGGGKGTLELAEDEDILEAGIRIISQPPGKKLQNMMQLSGGEKALTAIALLFAIQNLKPSPFCLLDEIEAALDDSNVGRFASYLQKLTKNTQFIIITHRRGTMNAADRLYGITMQEKGVSTLVSVDLVENQLTK